MENQELKSCPFCGCNEVILNYDSQRIDDNLYGHFTECQECYSSSGYFETEEEATAAWNKRVESTGGEIKKSTAIYDAIKDAIWDMFDGKIEIDDPTETTKIFISSVNKHLTT